MIFSSAHIVLEILNNDNVNEKNKGTASHFVGDFSLSNKRQINAIIVASARDQIVELKVFHNFGYSELSLKTDNRSDDENPKTTEVAVITNPSRDPNIDEIAP